MLLRCTANFRDVCKDRKDVNKRSAYFRGYGFIYFTDV